MDLIVAMKVAYPILSLSALLAAMALYCRWRIIGGPLRIVNVLFYVLDSITVLVLSLSVFGVAKLDDTRIYIVTLRSIMSVVALSIFYFVILEMYTQRKK